MYLPHSPVKYLPIAAATVVGPFDLCARVGGNLVPLSELPDTGTLAGNQTAAAAAFDGRSVGQHTGREGVDGQLAVAFDVVEYACDPTDFEVDDLIGPVEDASGTRLENRKIAKVSSAANAIGRAAEGGTQLTRVRVRLIDRNATL